MEGARIRRLEGRDIDAAIALTDLEGWGYTRADFLRLMDLSPEGCFTAELDGRLVGVLSTTTYEGHLAYLGAVIVAPELRGKGLGRSMMNVALDHLRSKGVRTVRLNAYLHARSFYRKLGFVEEHEVVRWSGPAVRGGRISSVRPIRERDLPAVTEMDARAFGATRAPLLRRLAEEFPDRFLVAEEAGVLRGYVVGNVSGAACEVGPWVARPGDAAAAENLYYALVSSTGATTFAFSGPVPNDSLVRFVARLGYAERFRTVRMWWGSPDSPGDLRGLWALAGLEKG